MTILIDTGSPWDANHILKSLNEINFHPNDINYVVCTHGHLDHVGLLSHFTNSKIILGADMGMATNCYSDDYSVKTTDFKICDDAFITFTPGHTNEDISLIAEVNSSSLSSILHTSTQSKPFVTVAFAGDLFENSDDENSWRSLSSNTDLQEYHRTRIQSLAEVIVPGHGGPFVSKLFMQLN
ncbi:metallo-beta-lactamase domain-containing protein 1-like [Symsagittifera roscoffensis]|uniref:metallo-beta-lactamase domain-containing protein 1-like n=1 Tax=Symsagittifera roscoffensis TaxID=84072 RepID=UPI00307B3A5F